MHESAGATAAFPAEEYAARLRAVRGAMDEQGMDALLLASPENIYYLCGLNHAGHFAVTLLALGLEGRPLLVARAMEAPTLRLLADQCEHVAYEDADDPGAAAVGALRRFGRAPRGLGVERSAMSLPIEVWDSIRARLGAQRWVDASKLVARERMVKSPRELAYVRRAAAISDQALQRGLAVAAEGVSERAVAAAIHAELIAAGSETSAVPPLVRSTPTLQLEHITWSDRRLARGDTLFVELSASVERYHAPLSRLAYVGEAPSGAAEAAEHALAGFEAARGALRPGARASDVYAAWQQAINAALGHSRYRRHHCGYVTGIGFPPSWSGAGVPVGLRPGQEFELREGMMFHLFSWILGQEPVDYGVSDTAIVTADGCELLTTTAREPTVV
jgi:Xaa-Pro aminopeptidase